MASSFSCGVDSSFFKWRKKGESYLALLVDRLETGSFAHQIDALPKAKKNENNESIAAQHSTTTQYPTHLAICDRVSKSKLFIDVFTSRHPMYCNKNKIRNNNLIQLE